MRAAGSRERGTGAVEQHDDLEKSLNIDAAAASEPMRGRQHLACCAAAPSITHDARAHQVLTTSPGRTNTPALPCEVSEVCVLNNWNSTGNELLSLLIR